MTGIKRGEAPPRSRRRPSTRSSAPRKDDSGKADAAQAAEQVVFRVTDIVVPTLDIAVEEAKRDAGNPQPLASPRTFSASISPAWKARSA